MPRSADPAVWFSSTMTSTFVGPTGAVTGAGELSTRTGAGAAGCATVAFGVDDAHPAAASTATAAASSRGERTSSVCPGVARCPSRIMEG